MHGRFLEAYALGPAGTVLVRPDSFVAWRADGSAAAEALLRGEQLAAIVAGGESARGLGLVAGKLRVTGRAVHLDGRRLHAGGGASIGLGESMRASATHAAVGDVPSRWQIPSGAQK